VEGSASYRTGISCALQQAGISVVEVERPTRSTRRRAESQTSSTPTMQHQRCWPSGPVRSRIQRWPDCALLQRAYRSAVKAGTTAGNQIKSILVTDPEPVRAKFCGMGVDQLVSALLRCRGCYADPIVADRLVALKTLAERHRGLSRQIEALTAGSTRWSPPSTRRCGPTFGLAPTSLPTC
jgi:transposase